MTDLVERLRKTLGGVAQEESGGDNLAILLASYFEPSIEDDEMDDSETWKQGAIDASNRVLDAIHAHYAAALEDKDKELAASRAERDHAKSWLKTYRHDLPLAESRAETAERERDEAQFGFENELKIKQELAGALREAQRERDEAREALKPFAKVTVTHPITLLRMGILREERDAARAITGEKP